MSKPYNTAALEQNKGVGREDGGKGSAGLYRHPESGQEAHTQWDPLFGDAQSNAFERLGFVRIRDSHPDEIKTVPSVIAEAADKDAKSLKGLSARLGALEGVKAENTTLADENARLRAELEAAKTAAPAAETTPDAEEDTSEVAPLDPKATVEALKAVGEAEGVELTGTESKKELIAAIEAKRAAVNNESETN